MRIPRATSVLLPSLLIFCVIAEAQAPQAAIVGRVEDASGAAIDGATVRVKSLETGVARSATTDESGNYRVLLLPIGPQQVTAEKTGFRQAVRTGINLAVGQEAVVNLRLEVGEFIQQMVVSDGLPPVNLTTEPVAGIVGEREVKD